MIERRQFLIAAAAAAPITLLGARVALAAEPAIYNESGMAIDGSDAVAYFTEGAPVAGSPDITHDWNGVTWRFSTEANRAAFAADPESYAPQFGGYCAYAVAQGYTAPTVPEAWTIHEGKLYLNFSRRIRNRWERDIPGNIALGEANWPAVLG